MFPKFGKAANILRNEAGIIPTKSSLVKGYAKYLTTGILGQVMNNIPSCFAYRPCGANDVSTNLNKASFGWWTGGAGITIVNVCNGGCYQLVINGLALNLEGSLKSFLPTNTLLNNKQSDGIII